MAKRTSYRGPWGLNDPFAQLGFSSAAHQFAANRKLTIVFDPKRAFDSRKDGRKLVERSIKTGIGEGTQSSVGLTFLLYGMVCRTPYIMMHNSSGGLHWFVDAALKDKSDKFLQSLRATIALRRGVDDPNSFYLSGDSSFYEDRQQYEWTMPSIELSRKTVRNLLAATMPWHKDYQHDMLELLERANPILVTYTNNFPITHGSKRLMAFSMDAEELR